jgi:hypothetical protein
LHATQAPAPSQTCPPFAEQTVSAAFGECVHSPDVHASTVHGLPSSHCAVVVQASGPISGLLKLHPTAVRRTASASTWRRDGRDMRPPDGKPGEEHIRRARSTNS